ncbi:MAG: glycoside hydrolase family 15 protein [Acidimicrobiia bacterium]
MSTEVRAQGPPSIGDYALIGDSRGVALVSNVGAIDWCCLPRPDSGSCFGRLLDRDKGGTLSISPTGEFTTERKYLADTLVLETVFRTDEGSIRLLDCIAVDDRDTGPRLIRAIEGIEGEVDVDVVVSPRFEYGALKPWIREHPGGAFTAIGGPTGLVISGSVPLRLRDRHDLAAEILVKNGDRLGLTVSYAPPDRLDPEPPPKPAGEEWESIERTIDFWGAWVDSSDSETTTSQVRRSAIILKALSFAPTGAFIAAATTSLPEAVGGIRNWDYRYSWVRDSAFAARALIELGFRDEATKFRQFVERSAAGSADDLQPMYGVGGEIRLPEMDLGFLDGYRGSRPVRIGNAAFPQRQLDLYGYLLDLAWRWQRHGVPPSEPYWEFLVTIVDAACQRWSEPDRGIWEVRGDPQHFVHSKVMCWSAVDCGLRLADALGFTAPIDRWMDARTALRESIESRGFDEKRGVFVRSYDGGDLDAALLLIPWVGFVAFDDERMINTTDEIRATLGQRGLIRRYTAADGLEGEEGAFVACTFWLAECLARQGRLEEARQSFEAAMSTGNDLGLFSEEYHATGGEMLGNFPQAMSHFSHITASCAIQEMDGAK